MAFEQNFQDPTFHFECVGDVSLKQVRKSLLAAETTASENMNGCFECNICLDSAHDPVVTLCGHLFCWPCIYRWLQVRSSSPESEIEPNCPVCKATVSNSSLVPLYGRSNSVSESDAKRPKSDVVIPRRPPALGVSTLPIAATNQNQQFHSNPFQQQPPSFPQQQYFPNPLANYASMSPSHVGGTTMTSFYSPTVGMFGEMVFARMFGSSDSTFVNYPYANSYPTIGGGTSPRLRRQELQVYKSLNRVSIFLLCCFLLCLFLF